MEGRSGGEATVGVSGRGSRKWEAQRPLDFAKGHVIVCEGVTQKWSGSWGNIPIGSSVAGHVQKFSLVFENFRKREVERLLYIKGGDVVRLRFKVLVGLMVRNDVSPQRGREKDGEVC